MSNEWKKVEDEIFKFDKEGDSIEGILTAKEVGHMFGNEVYKIKTSEKTMTVFGTTVLTSLMNSVKIGDEVKIVFTGTKETDKKGQSPIKLFEVFVK